MKLIKLLWNFASQFSGVVSTIAIVFLGIGFFIQLIKSWQLRGFYLILVIGFFLSLLILSIGFLIKYFSASFKRLTNAFREEEINDDLKKFEEKSIKTVGKLKIPQTIELRKLHNVSLRKAREWSEDAEEINTSIIIDVIGHKTTYLSQIYFFSKWKSQELVVFLPRYATLKRDQEQPVTNKAKPFYDVYPNWSKVVNKALVQLIDKLSDRFTLWLYSDPEEFRFSFVVYEKDTSRRYEYSFDGRFLKIKDKSIEIK